MDDAPRDRDETSGQFVMGHNGGPGRPRGSRNLLSTQFLNDLRDAWAEHGKTALTECATKDPVQFCKIVSGLLPAHAEIDLNVDMYAGVSSVLEAFRMMSAAVGGDSERVIRGLRRTAPHLLELHDVES
jgi:hypothetical protein